MADGKGLAPLTWALLQERITTTLYSTEKFTYPLFLNTIQSLFASLLGFLYLKLTTPNVPILPTPKILPPLFLVAVTTSLSSPFGYASLNHVDYITFILAKSCKLLPVLILHTTLYQRRYPWWKYLVVGLVTAGVAVFTLHQNPSKKRKGSQGSSLYGLGLLGINLLLDGLTNTTQDEIYARFRFSAQQMMCALNMISTGITGGVLVVGPWLVETGFGRMLGVRDELGDAVGFVKRHPEVGWDLMGFALCGAVGQVFIFMTLSQFGSLLLVTVTVTRKMLSMLLSVVWFGHGLSGMQWVGVGLVFGGIGVEAELSKREKRKKMKKID
ncbi:UAA transporter [Piedraia hortae CBS 480.64]|uniref:UDP-galactose transporter homolog 1 n=1 Tax=Piedraia hortae CBS 480.64 TaxID=1314780 RepID=A0A6A7BZX8_9PEZI|nr:UAA transporter [Piedraia hortae CBS 480.64]